MQAVAEQTYRKLLEKIGLKAADPGSSIGKQLAFVVPVPRMVVLYFAGRNTETYVPDAVLRVLELSDEWLLTPRYGSASDLGLLPGASTTAAVSFGASEHPQLARYLCTRSMDPNSQAQDLYVLSGKGHALVTWDHHTAEEGLKIELLSISDAARLLVSLNELGAELDLISDG
jgi:hypothetical protein